MRIRLISLGFFALSFISEATTISLKPGKTPVIQQAIDRLSKDDGFTLIRLAPGTYREKITIPTNKPPLKFVGNPGETRIVFNDSAKTRGPDGREIGTFRSATITIESDDFTAEGITFENDHGPGIQAVALSVGGDRAIFCKCRFLGWQDTLLVRRKRQFFDQCKIAGSVDFIFGDATAYFKNCHIHCRDHGYITAASTDEDKEFGYVFSNCRITSEPNLKVYLGRPWRPHASVHFLECRLPDTIRPEGWNNWRDPKKEKTARYHEWQNTGPGAATDSRVSWLRPLEPAQGRGIQRPWRVFRKWDPMVILSEERVASLPPEEQKKWQAYLQRSRSELNRSQNILRKELADQDIDAPRTPKDGGRPPSAKRDPDWFRSDQANDLAAVVISFQTPNGGWAKNLDYRQGKRTPGTHWSAQSKGPFGWHYVGTLDNNATTGELLFLARHHLETQSSASKTAVLRGIDFLLNAQYPSGGWPQGWPLEGGYHDQITLNDDAMLNALELLNQVAGQKKPFTFVGDELRQRAQKAVAQGIDCLLNAQIVIDGTPTIWCAQHDPLTLAPSGARMQEPASLSSYESISVIRFLEQMEKVDNRIPPALRAARTWYRDHAVTGIIRSRQGKNLRYQEGTSDPALWWGRFHDLKTQKPIFPGAQCAGIHATFQSLAAQNTTAYQYYCDRPRDLLR